MPNQNTVSTYAATLFDKTAAKIKKLQQDYGSAEEILSRLPRDLLFDMLHVYPLFGTTASLHIDITQTDAKDILKEAFRIFSMFKTVPTAMYRDGCISFQPLKTARTAEASDTLQGVYPHLTEIHPVYMKAECTVDYPAVGTWKAYVDLARSGEPDLIIGLDLSFEHSGLVCAHYSRTTEGGEICLKDQRYELNLPQVPGSSDTKTGGGFEYMCGMYQWYPKDAALSAILGQ